MKAAMQHDQPCMVNARRRIPEPDGTGPGQSKQSERKLSN
jgi:hypothetical protein